MNYSRVFLVKNGFNFRELGGYHTLNNALIKWHKLLRTSNLAFLNPQECSEIYDYGIRTIIDLRSPSEINSYPDQLPLNIKYFQIPVFKSDQTESNVEIENTKRLFSQDAKAGFNRMMRVYRQMVINSEAQQAYQQFFEVLAKRCTYGGILFHCSAGKDRTGFASILLLNALDVPEQIIKHDYLLTNKLSQKRIQERLDYAKKLHVNNSYLNSIYDLSTVNEYYYDQAVSLINYEYGGMHNYIHDMLSVDKLCLEKLKSILLLKKNNN